jgi:hypothetical protein
MKGFTTSYILNFSYSYKHIKILCLVLTKGRMFWLDLKIKVHDLLQIRQKACLVKNFWKIFCEGPYAGNSA